MILVGMIHLHHQIMSYIRGDKNNISCVIIGWKCYTDFTLKFF